MRKMMTEVRKRKEGHKSAWAWLIITVIWSLLGIFIIAINGFDYTSQDAWLPAVLWLMAAGLFAGGLHLTIRCDQHEKTTEYLIHEYEAWDVSKSDYVKYYFIEAVSIRSRFIFHYHLEDFESRMDSAQLETWLRKTRDEMEWTGWNGHKTQEGAMLEIIGNIRKIIATEKETQNIKIRNIRTLETFTVADLKGRVSVGEFKEIEDADKKRRAKKK